VDSFTINLTTGHLGAVCLGARSPWANVAAAGANHALGLNSVLAAGTPDVRRAAAFRPLQPTSVQVTEPTPAAITMTSKPEYVHKTRINAGGYGAMGPHPERERLA
jgi:hypothetical protein